MIFLVFFGSLRDEGNGSRGRHPVYSAPGTLTRICPVRCPQTGAQIMRLSAAYRTRTIVWALLPVLCLYGWSRLARQRSNGHVVVLSRLPVIILRVQALRSAAAACPTVKQEAFRFGWNTHTGRLRRCCLHCMGVGRAGPCSAGSINRTRLRFFKHVCAICIHTRNDRE